MALLGSATCARCGASVASGVARCPFCGATVDASKAPPPAATAPTPPVVPPSDLISVRPRLPLAPTAPKKPNWTIPAAAAGILFAGALAILALGKRTGPEGAMSNASAAPASAPPSATSTARAESYPDPTKVDASDLYPKAKQRALAWNADARLVSIAANPVFGDKVDLT